MWNMSCTVLCVLLAVLCVLLAVFGDKRCQQVSVRSLRSLSFQFENFLDCRRTKEKVVTESHHTGGKPVQSHRLGGKRQTGVRNTELLHVLVQSCVIVLVI